MSSKEADFSFKIVLTGNSGVGKTNFLSRFDKDQFINETKPTIGVQFASKKMIIKEKTIKVQIWDTSGQEKFNTITTAYFRGAIGAILFYDITDQESFESVSHWLQTLRKEADNNSVLMLVGNKCDLENQRKVSTEQGEDFAKRENLLFIEASALNSTNVEQAFTNLFTEIVDRLIAKKEKKNSKGSEQNENEIQEKTNTKENHEPVTNQENESENYENETDSSKPESQEENQEESVTPEQKAEDQNNSSDLVHIVIQKEKITEVIEYVRELEGKLGKYEDVSAFDFQEFMSSVVNERNDKKAEPKETRDEEIVAEKEESQNEIKKEEQNDEKEPTKQEEMECKEMKEEDLKQQETQNESNKGNESFFLGDDDEKDLDVRRKIGEGTSSIAYKVVDTRDSHVMCKKILKTEDTSSKFTNILIQEFGDLHRICHPCICKLIGINPKEKISSSTEKQCVNKEKNSEEEEYYETVIIKPKRTDENKIEISLFFEYLDFSLKSCLEKDILTNTLKTKIALEVAFGVAYLHKLGMIHRDLRIDNIMLNSGFEAKIIDFGLIHHGIDEMLTRDIGALTYMSPELQNEDDYDNKTDVYSYGVVLYVVFSGKLPKQKMKDKLNKVPPHFPKPSSSISNVCIKLIKMCMSFEPKERPSFDAIIEYMKTNSFVLADEVDFGIVSRRYNELTALKDQ